LNTGDEYYVPDDEYDPEGEPETVETFADVPHDFKFIHISTTEGELMRLRDEQDPINLIETMPGTGAESAIPLHYDFVHLQNQDGDDIMRYI